MFMPTRVQHEISFDSDYFLCWSVDCVSQFAPLVRTPGVRLSFWSFTSKLQISMQTSPATKSECFRCNSTLMLSQESIQIQIEVSVDSTLYLELMFEPIRGSYADSLLRSTN